MPTDDKISQLPTGTIDALNAIMPMSVNITGSAPQTIQASLQQIVAFLNAQGQLVTTPLQEYIYGLGLEYNSSGSVSVYPGAAYIPSLNRISRATSSMSIQFASPVTTTTSGSWQHVYYYENSIGTPSIELVTTPPNSIPYAGVARTKLGDDSRRYLGSVYCDTNGWIYRFTSVVTGNVLKMNWLISPVNFPFQVGSSLTGDGTLPVTHLVPIQKAFVGILTQLILSIAAGGDQNVSIGDSNPSVVASNNTAEVPVRFSNFGGGSTATLFLPPYELKITGNTLSYTQQNNAGSNSFSVRIKGVSIQR